MNDALSNQDAINQQIERNPRFHELVRKRQAFATLLSLIMLVLYVGFILLIAFAPAGSARRCMPVPTSRAVSRLVSG